MNGEIAYFRTECPAFSDMVLVELTEINGTSFLYASATETNPGPLTNDTVSNETLGISRRTVTVQIPDQAEVKELAILESSARWSKASLLLESSTFFFFADCVCWSSGSKYSRLLLTDCVGPAFWALWGLYQCLDRGGRSVGGHHLWGPAQSHSCCDEQYVRMVYNLITGFVDLTFVFQLRI